jgi:hypothetical protein
MKRLLHRIGSHNAVKHSSQSAHNSDATPPVPTLNREIETSSEDLTSTQDDNRRGTTPPARSISPSSFSNGDAPSISQATGQQPHGSGQPNQSGLAATVTVTATSTEEKIWSAVNNPNGNVSKSEKNLNKVDDRAGMFYHST